MNKKKVNNGGPLLFFFLLILLYVIISDFLMDYAPIISTDSIPEVRRGWKGN